MLNDHVNNDGKNPEIPFGSFWGSSQQIPVIEILASSGQRGTPDNERFASGSFPADLSNTSIISIAEIGDPVNDDVDIEARAVCDTFGNGIPG